MSVITANNSKDILLAALANGIAQTTPPVVLKVLDEFMPVPSPMKAATFIFPAFVAGTGAILAAGVSVTLPLAIGKYGLPLLTKPPFLPVGMPPLLPSLAPSPSEYLPLPA